MSGPVESLLNRLDAVKENGRGKWLARCPAHKDKRPSLSIREADSGAVLVKCWTGCTVAEIAGAVGLELSELFPPREPFTDGKSTQRRERVITAADGLRLLDFEADVVCIAADRMARGGALDIETRDALTTARITIRNVYREVLV
ncbi:MAG TPA: DNA primase [Casimicrobium sp.]|nr:DNA primase [Casimicrobium sp.]